MARIYALAKELNLDSKDLVDLVKKVGITGKGSALASLTDEEAQRVRDHLSGGGSKGPAAAPAAKPADESAPVAVREAVRPERKPVNLKAAAKAAGGGGKAPSSPKPAGKPEPKLRAPAPLHTARLAWG